MNIDKENERIWCHICFKWIDAKVEILKIENKDIFCIHHEPWDAAHLGYRWDWPEIYGNEYQD